MEAIIRDNRTLRTARRRERVVDPKAAAEQITAEAEERGAFAIELWDRTHVANNYRYPSIGDVAVAMAEPSRPAVVLVADRATNSTGPSRIIADLLGDDCRPIVDRRFRGDRISGALRAARARYRQHLKS